MSFISAGFFFFFPVVTILYFLAPYRFRWAVLLLASCVFYMAFVPAYILVMLWLILVDYTVGIYIEQHSGFKKWALLMVSVISLVGILFVFKYFNFFNTNVALLAEFLGWNYSFALLSLALPLGLSFHTFQSLSYVIEVYRGKQKAERHFGIYALYVMFYPQLVAGPIERPQHLLPQLHSTFDFDYDRVKMGLLRMTWGFFKKMVVADRLAVVVNHVFANPSAFDGPQLIVASIFFTLQLYFDFSAYCDIGLGAAQVMGFKLMENFDRPFLSRSIAEFWRRWHISLSSWFRDYFYFPVVFSWRHARFGMYAAILLTFLVTGFWHGANWTFGVFGLMNGLYIVIGQLTQKYRDAFAKTIGISKYPKFHNGIKICIVFLLFVCACIFFRAQNVYDGWYILTHLADWNFQIIHLSYIFNLISELGISAKSFAFALLLAIVVFYAENMSKSPWAWIVTKPLMLRWVIYWCLIFAIIALNQSTSSPFIYFQF